MQYRAKPIDGFDMVTAAFPTNDAARPTITFRMTGTVRRGFLVSPSSVERRVARGETAAGVIRVEPGGRGVLGVDARTDHAWIVLGEPRPASLEDADASAAAGTEGGRGGVAFEVPYSFAPPEGFRGRSLAGEITLTLRLLPPRPSEAGADGSDTEVTVPLRVLIGG